MLFAVLEEMSQYQPQEVVSNENGLAKLFQ